MFRGDSALNMDAKGRLAVPARVRERLDAADGNCLVVTVSLNHPCLSAYPMTKWRQVEDRLRQLPTFNKQAVALRQALVGSAHETVLDGQNRILLPPALREYANLEKRVCMVGQIDRVDIWNEAAWNNQRLASLEQVREIAGNLDEELRSVVL